MCAEMCMHTVLYFINFFEVAYIVQPLTHDQISDVIDLDVCVCGLVVIKLCGHTISHT